MGYTEALSLSLINKLLLTISLYKQRYQLSGCTINVNTRTHFVAIIMWHGRPYFYDGMQPTKKLRFVPYCPDSMKFTSHLLQGSYAYYFIVH